MLEGEFQEGDRVRVDVSGKEIVLERVEATTSSTAI
jgi:hypothetical protein